MGAVLKCPERVLLQPKPAPLTKTMFYISVAFIAPIRRRIKRYRNIMLLLRGRDILVEIIRAVVNMFPHIIRTIPLFFYDLDGQKKAYMYKALNERRMLIAKENHGKLSEDMSCLVEMLSGKG